MFSKKIVLIIIAVLLIIFILSFVCFLVLKKQIEKPSLVPEEKTLEEILKNLTASSTGEQPKVSAEAIKSLTAPRQGEVSEDILQSLTAPK